MTFMRSKRIRLRTLGVVFLVIAFLVQLAAWNTGTNLLYLVTGCLISFVAISYLLSLRTLSGLKVFRTAPASVHRGEPFAVTVRIENHKRLAPSLSLRIRGTSNQGATETDEVDGYIVKVPAQQAAIVRLPDLLPRRGVHALPPVSVSSGFPFGLFERRGTYPAPTEIVVYPRVRALRATTLEQMYGGGETPRLLRGESDEFFCIREYNPGDDLRRISWKISARLQKLVVREMEPSTSHNILIGFDTCRAPEVENFDEHFEEAVDLVASLALSLLNRQYAVALVTPDHELDLGEGTAHTRRVLDLLARIQPVSASDYSAGWFDEFGDRGAVAYAYVSANPDNWGARVGMSRTRVLDPREVVHA